ncbi:ferredoxin-thioredoxin reductase, variable chain [Mercurialis annua]|uniref:ferredoxin-thioredoxin reductase, variable chain n=1 Tax=Mercurialis annua TaxID=3986 RepID=UPI00215E09AC|nr:ferredoxin-thioredoxin reductase, variable chain [Mercurialis annua]
MSSTPLVLPSAASASATASARFPLFSMNLTSSSSSFPAAYCDSYSTKKFTSCLAPLHSFLTTSITKTTPASIIITKEKSTSRRTMLVSCQASPSSTTVEEQEQQTKVGARVRVKAPLKVYHVPRIPELDLTGKEGRLKQYVALWKGKRISANFPYKVEFLIEVEGRGAVKFFAHLKEDEFEFLD